MRGRSYILLDGGSDVLAAGSELVVLASERTAGAVEILDANVGADSLPGRAAAVRPGSTAYSISSLNDDAAVRQRQSLAGVLADSDADPDSRSAALGVLTDLGGEESAIAIGAIFADADPALREEALYALAEIGGTTAVAYVRAALTDGDELVREAARDVLDSLLATD